MGKRDTAVAFVLGNLPNARQHQRLAVLVAEVIRLLASLIPPFREPLAGNDAAPFFEMLSELSLAHAVRANIKQRRPGFIAGTQPVNAEAREDDALPCDKHRDKLRRRDMGGPISAPLGEQTDADRVAPAHQPMAVMLDLVDRIGAGRWLSGLAAPSDDGHPRTSGPCQPIEVPSPIRRPGPARKNLLTRRRPHHT